MPSLEWVIHVLGNAELVGADAAGVIVEIGRRPARLGDAGLEWLASVPAVAPATLAPFSTTELGGGKKLRLAWPAGATTISAYSYQAVWDERHAVVVEQQGLTVVDARGTQVRRISTNDIDALAWESHAPVVCGGRLWLGARQGVVAIPLEALEQIEGPTAISLRRVYPLRQPQAQLGVVYLWKLQNGMTMVEIGDGRGGANEPKLRISLPAEAEVGLRKYGPMTLCDELFPGCYAAAEVNGRRYPLVDEAPRPLQLVAATGRAKDPVRVAAAPAAHAVVDRRADIDQLVAKVALDPESADEGAVLVDALIEMGDPTGDILARLRRGAKVSAADRKLALGALSPYLDHVELAGGFPVAARVAREAPEPDDHADLLAAAADDFRLAVIRTLHGHRASPEVYAALAGSPRATSLRRAWGGDATVLQALIDARRTSIERLDHIDVADRDAMALLADATFDGARTLHAVVGLAHVQPFANRVIRDKARVFARAPRELVLEDTRGRNEELERAIREWLPRLPVVAVTIGEVRLMP